MSHFFGLIDRETTLLIPLFLMPILSLEPLVCITISSLSSIRLSSTSICLRDCFFSFIVWIKELVYRDVKQGSNEIKFVQSRMLPAVLYVPNRAWCKVNKLSKIFLCPIFCFHSLFYPYTYWLEIKFSFVLVYFNITPISFYISSDKI